MGFEIALTCVVALAMAAMLTGVVRRFALARGLLDVPNARSSHSVVTPRGGGLAMVLAASAAFVALALLCRVPVNLFLALLGGGTVVAAIGFLDDRRPVPAKLRLAVHVCAAVWAVTWIGAPAELRVGSQLVHLGWAGPVMGALGIVWVLNLFNFMDGIDGIAAAEGVFMACAGAALTAMGGVSASVVGVGWAVGAASLGFLLWNWPPARIFMGDVGSGYLGYVIGVVMLATARADPSALWVWLILGGVFFVDATLTLARRTMRGDRVFEAHRSHAYQWLARRWGSHRRVTIATVSVNVIWLLPCAIFAAGHPDKAAWTALGALNTGARRCNGRRCGQTRKTVKNTDAVR